MVEIWLAYTDYIESKDNLSTKILQALKVGVKDKNKSLKIVAISLMFKLLDTFAELRISTAPVLYKLLIYSLVEHA